MSTLKLYLLGAPRLKHGRDTVRLARQKSLALLAYLAATGREHPRPTLMALLWPDFAETQARQGLRTALADIRRASDDDHLIVEADTVALNPAALWLDLQALAAGTLPGIPAPFLEGFTLKDAPAFDDWAAVERDRWLQVAIKQFRARAEAEEAQAQFAQALETTQHLLALDPLQEAVQRQRMRLHYALGDRTAALQQFETARDLLDRELGVEPMAETRALYEQIQAAAPALSGATRAAPHTTPRAAEPSLASLPFIGRAAEKAALGRAWETASAGQAQWVFVNGEAGVGKTRLVDEAAQTWTGTRLLRGTSHPLDANQPYHPIVDLLRDFARDLAAWPSLPGFGDEWLSELARLAPDLREKRSALPAALRVQTVQERSGLVEAEQERNRLFEATSRFLGGLTAIQPVAVLLDDVHWADPSTLALLAYLAHTLPQARLLVVCTYRGAESTPALESLLHALSRGGQLTRLALHRLEPGDVVALTQAVTCQDSLPFAAWLYHESEGNPFFIREIVAYLLDAGLATPGAHGWQTDLQKLAARLPEAALPATVHDLIQARLQRTSETARQWLDVAAITGRAFDFATLERASGKDPDRSLDALDELLRAQLVRQTADTATPYEFTHTKIREVILKEMSLARQQILHRRVAEALEITQHARLPELAGALAEHFRAAGDWPKAARYARLAGDHARAVLALPEAAAFYTAALDALAHAAEQTMSPGEQTSPGEQASSGEAARVHAAQGEVYRALGQPRRALESYARAFAIWEQAGDRARLAALRFEMGLTHMFLSEYREVAELAQAGLSDLADLPQPDERLVAQGHVLWGNALSLEGRAFAEARTHLEQALAAFTRADDRAGLVQTHFTLGNVAAQEGDLELAVSHFQQAMDEAGRGHDTVMEALACNNLAYHLGRLGRVAEARAVAQRGLALAEAHSVFSALVYLYGTLGDLCLGEQQWDTAESWLQKGLALTEQLNSAERRADYLAKLAELAYGRAQLPLALEHLQEAARLADELGARHASAQYHLRLAAWLAEQGAAGEARAHWERGFAIARDSHYVRLLQQAEALR